MYIFKILKREQRIQIGFNRHIIIYMRVGIEGLIGRII